MPIDTDYIITTEILSAFGKINEIKKKTFYFNFSDARSAATAHSKIKNLMNVQGPTIVSSIHNKRYVADNPNNYIYECYMKSSVTKI